MKAELNDSLRLRFFAQYLNCCDCGDQGEEFCVEWDSNALISLLEAEQEQAFLYLRPIDSITDGELLRISAFLDIATEYKTAVHMRKIISMNDAWGNTSITRINHLHIRDELVSMGFAVEFMGHSVEGLVNVGWVKLIN
jgi:hypothetical protein